MSNCTHAVVQLPQGMYLVVFLAGPLVERIAIGARTLIFAKCYAFLGATIENGRRLRMWICK